ncbi:type I methionyl aminopeptidase [Archangium violaceum]|uniref:type I methionyl aminopeptidase n=1 Tax=Archangium violaceum TaxID=83451 RepID=UPI00194DCB07|nr:type I methionyl aminopeptidase [Archangium violaceum]QRN98230.1 type I methionyl aminopeptidase [Archangium violaceum]
MTDVSTVRIAPAVLPKPNDPCWCGSGTKYKKCHRGADSVDARKRGPEARPRGIRPGLISPIRSVPPHIPRPDYADTVSGRPSRTPAYSEVKSPEVIARIRRACKAAAEVLNAVGAHVRPGITTDELDAITHEEYIKRGGYPSTLNYYNFPKSLCTSVNEVICHGIPDNRPLEDGDIINLDVTIFLDGVHGDCSATFFAGTKDPEDERLVRITYESMMLGIEAVKPGLPINVIGRAIENHAHKHNLGVVRAFCGHGIGERFQTGLQIPHNYDPSANTIMQPGMVFTIEPMLTLGHWHHRVWDDGWTAVTADGSRTAQFEHTVLVTDTGVEILTVA